MNFLYSPNRLSCGGAADAGTAAPTSASVCRRYRIEPLICLHTNAHQLSTTDKMVCELNQRKITELLTFLHSNDVNIAAIQEAMLTNVTKPL